MQTLKAVQERFKNMRVIDSNTSDALTNILGVARENGEVIKPLVEQYLESINVEPTKADTMLNELELAYSERLDNANQVPNGNILGIPPHTELSRWRLCLSSFSHQQCQLIKRFGYLRLAVSDIEY